MGTVDGPPLPLHTAGSFPTLLVERWRLVCAVNDRGKTDEDSIPTPAAWHRVAKMLFPEEPVRFCTKRDDWLISLYRLRPGPYYGMGFDEDDRTTAPPELIAEVDRAYFRKSLQDEVDGWFKERGFDPDAPTISKHQFEAAFQAEFGRLPFEPVKTIEKSAGKRAAVSKPATSADARADFVRRYFDSTKRPSMKECENNWAKEHGSSARELLRNDYRDEAKRRKINVKRGPQNFAK